MSINDGLNHLNLFISIVMDSLVVGENSGRAVVSMVGEGLNRTCCWARSSFFFETDLA